ncbi:xanthine dehydrogenase accessory protein XdhC [Lentisalinibacter salinarum]|uniref:xanthine dehydrogenase accessory protein XdhC n=1 Tax=Lentisalinibacter salinarum TaxID=2992239 RepID=UPI00386D6CCA
MNEWVADALELRARGEPFVLVTVAGARGSSPREPGARMVVTREEILGTIGGGELEYHCARLAWERLRPDSPQPRFELRCFPLGPSFGQCCGGIVDIHFETVRTDAADWLGQLAGGTADGMADEMAESDTTVLVTPVDGDADGIARVHAAGNADAAAADGDDDIRSAIDAFLADGAGAAVYTFGGRDYLLTAEREPDFRIAVFGAGHVGSALVHMLAPLPCRVDWIDSRPLLADESLPHNIHGRVTADPPDAAANLPAGTFCLVMTHSHPLDLEICAKLLPREDIPFCGLIGSRSKKRRFEKRLRALGLKEAAIARMVCPIGIEGIGGKRPAEIAVAVAAQLLRERERMTAEADLTPARPAESGTSA